MLTSVSDRCGEEEQNHLWLAQRRHHFPQVAAHGDNDNDKHHFITSLKLLCKQNLDKQFYFRRLAVA